MLKKKLALGRGAKQLIPNINELERLRDAPKESGVSYLSISSLHPGKLQPRRVFNEEALLELASSIKQQGVIQPIVVRSFSKSSSQYEIIAGERRWRASKLAGLNQVPVVIKNVSDETAMAFALIENIQREDLNALEEAKAYESLIQKFQLTQSEVATKVGKARSTITNFLRLLTLSSSVQDMLSNDEIELGHAKVLVSVSDQDKQESLAQEVSQKKLTVRQLESLVHHKIIKKTQSKVSHSECSKWGRALTKKLSSKVTVKLNEQGVGKVVIEVNSESEMKWLVENI
jgi:ParB family transcriptional regulator, chromosome partitioning protein